MQWWHSKVLKTGCSVRNVFKSEMWNTQAASYNVLGMYPGHEPAKFCDNPLKHINSSA